MEAEQREPDGWSHGASVYCDGKYVNSGCAFSARTITAVTYNSYCTNKFDEENWKKMGAALSESNALTKLDLGNLSRKAATILFGGAIRYNWPSLKVLELNGNLGLGGIKTVCSALKSTSNLDKFSLTGTKLGVGVVKLLVDMLNHTRIEYLRLHSGKGQWRSNASANIKFNDEELEKLLAAKNARHLVHLCIGGVDITARGYETISRFLQSEGTVLKVLDIPVDTDNSAKLLIDSIPHQSKLEVIQLPSPENVEDAILDSVCNTSSFEALYNSNHRLFKVGHLSKYDIKDNEVRKRLLAALEINTHVRDGAPISYAIRRKVRYFYFEDPDFDVSIFNDMDVALMPHALELVTRVEFPEDWATQQRRRGLPRNMVCSDKLNGIFRLLKNCHVSELFSFSSPEAQLCQKDQTIKQLEVANEDLTAEVERLKQTMDRLMAEKEERGRAGSSRPNKRAKTTDVESRLAALEADVASLKRKSS